MSKFYYDVLKQYRLKNLNNDNFIYKKSNNTYVAPTKKVSSPMFVLKPNIAKPVDVIPVIKPGEVIKPVDVIPVIKPVDIPKIESVEIKQTPARVKQLSSTVTSEIKNTNLPDTVFKPNNNKWSYNGKAYSDSDMKNIMNPNITDKVGLERAYASPERLYVHGNVGYVAGTSRPSDVLDDLALPFHLTRFTNKYKETDAFLNQHPEVTHLVGHSLGSATVHEIQKNYPERNYVANTYGVPTVSNSDDKTGETRYRNYGDGVSIFDRGSTMNFKPSVITKFFENVPLGFDHAIAAGILEAHSYDNFDKNMVSPNVDTIGTS